MKYSEAKQGRTFILRLEDGEIIHETVENFAREKNINSASLIILGGADKNSKLVVGPKDGRAEQIEPMEHGLNNVHEIAGVGTLFPNENEDPILHMHITAGRKNSAVTGCIRRGIKTWLITEIILTEIKDTSAHRKRDPESGFTLLEP
ncbi:MAG: DNA-binding protein [Candidatus Marinimicrobia bacterium]|nr:DNA-binding protein [Candidatus Neomarinimicrobiota bacterium]